MKLAFAPATGRGDTDTEDEEPFTEDDESVMEDDECVMEDDKAATEDDESDTKGEEAIVDSSLIRVNEEDKKLGVHCVMWVLSNIFSCNINLVKQAEKVIRGV